MQLADPRYQRCIHTIRFEISEDDFEKIEIEFSDDPNVVRIKQAEFERAIVQDPDGYCVVLFVDKR